MASEGQDDLATSQGSQGDATGTASPSNLLVGVDGAGRSPSLGDTSGGEQQSTHHKPNRQRTASSGGAAKRQRQEGDGDAKATANGGQGAGQGRKLQPPRPDKLEPCPRCNSEDTKFCYYNNYNVKQPRFFCKACQRYWTAGGTLRNVPPGAGRRKSKSAAAKENEKQHHLAEQLAKQGMANAMLAATPSLAGAVPFLNPMLAYNAAAQQQALLGSAALNALSSMPSGAGLPGQWAGAHGSGLLGSSSHLGSPTGLMNGSTHLLQQLGSPLGSDGTHLGGSGHALVDPLTHEASGSTANGGKQHKRQRVDASKPQEATHQQQQQQQQHVHSVYHLHGGRGDVMDPLGGGLGPAPLMGSTGMLGHNSNGGADPLNSNGGLGGGGAGGAPGGGVGQMGGGGDSSALGGALMGSNGYHAAAAAASAWHTDLLGAGAAAGLLHAQGSAGTAPLPGLDGLAPAPSSATAAASSAAAAMAAHSAALQQHQHQLAYQHMMHAHVLQQQLAVQAYAAAQAPNPYFSLPHLYNPVSSYNPAAAAGLAANLAGFHSVAGR